MEQKEELINTVTCIDKEGLSIPEIQSMMLQQFSQDMDYWMYSISYIKIAGNPVSTRDGEQYTVEVYGILMEVDPIEPISVGDNVINDLDGKEYMITAVSNRKEVPGVPVQVGRRVYLCNGIGETDVVYEWEVTKNVKN